MSGGKKIKLALLPEGVLFTFFSSSFFFFFFFLKADIKMFLGSSDLSIFRIPAGEMQRESSTVWGTGGQTTSRQQCNQRSLINCLSGWNSSVNSHKCYHISEDAKCFLFVQGLCYVVRGELIIYHSRGGTTTKWCLFCTYRFKINGTKCSAHPQKHNS